MLPTEHVHFQRLSGGTDMGTSQAGEALAGHMAGLHMLPHRAGGLGAVITAGTAPVPRLVLEQKARDNSVHF